MCAIFDLHPLLVSGGFGSIAQGFLPGVPVFCRDIHDLCMKKSDINQSDISALEGQAAFYFLRVDEFSGFFGSNKLRK